MDFYLRADPFEDDRINVFERRKDVDSVERFRGSGPSNEQQAVITEAQIHQHDFASTMSLT